LRFTLHGRQGRCIADYFHAARRIVDERVERQHRQHRAHGTRRVRAVHSQQLAQHRLPRDGIGGEMGVADHHFVAVTHRGERVQDIGVQERIDVLQHSVSSMRGRVSCRDLRPFNASVSLRTAPRCS
jgi:hypothetical protein